MWIGKATRDLNDIQIRSKKYSFKKDTRFKAQDGVLFEQLQADSIELIVDNVKEDIKEAIVFETADTAKDFDSIIAIRTNDMTKVSNVYAENAKLKAENESLKKELKTKANLETKASK